MGDFQPIKLLTIIAQPNKLDFVGLAQQKRPSRQWLPRLLLLWLTTLPVTEILGAVK
jgi:hypothetical protein